MGLEAFENGVHTGSYKKKSKQTDLTGQEVSSIFEDKWGITKHEASDNPEFIVRLIEEEDFDTSDICELFSCLEHTVFDLYVRAVDQDLINLPDIPDINHPAYREMHAKYYVKRALKNNRLDKINKSTTSTSKSKSKKKSTGLEAFKT